MSELSLRGRTASPGYAAGQAMVLAPLRSARAATGDAQEEAQALREALAVAAAEIAALAVRSGGEGADMLGFQLALIEDDALAEPAFAAIAGGAAGADAAWRAALDDEIAGYEAAQDEYFRARAADLMDVRDRVSAALAGEHGEHGEAVPAAGIVAAHDLPPSRFLGMDWSRGGAVLLAAGSPTSHVAMLARSRGIPMIVGLGGDPARLAGEVLVDATAGAVVLDPSPETRRAFEARSAQDRAGAQAAAEGVAEPAVTRDDTRIGVFINIADPDELEGLDPAICDGIGLVRTELLFHASGRLPDEERQYAAYRRILDWAASDGRARTVTVRTLDAGGDKPIAGLTEEGESNPFLGLRGIRLSLKHEDVFRAQLRALLRASAHGALKVMLPMVTVPSEVAIVRSLIAQEAAELAARGLAVGRPALGIMVEVPAAAIAIEGFEADFYSIGSNDLTQYVTAAGRDIGAVADLADPLNPAVLQLVARVAAYGAAQGREVSLCGDAGGDAAAIPHLLAAGVRALSVAPGLVAAAKAAIRAATLGPHANVPA